MWHEARKQEKKLRCMIVDYRKRAERRREFYEKFKADPTQFMQVHGRPSKIFLEPQIAASAENCMMPWQGNADNMIDRFDVRAHLDIIPEYHGGGNSSGNGSKSQAALEEEQNPGINYERYRILIQSDLSGTSEDKFLHQIHLEEQFGNSATPHSQMFGGKNLQPKVPKAAIGYNYEDSTPAFSTSSLGKNSQQGGGQPPPEPDEESEEEIDFDLIVNVDDLTHGQKAELNNFGTKYGLGVGDFMEYLNGDLEEKEKLRLAKLQEEEKQAMSGRKARRERRAYKDKLIMRKGYISPPSYATYITNSPTGQENDPETTTVSRRSSSRSESRSRSNSPEKITFITSFGGNESDDASGNRQRNTSGGKSLPFEPSNRHSTVTSGSHPVFGPSLPTGSEKKGSDSSKRGRFISGRSRSLDFSSSSNRRRTNRSRSRSNSSRRRSSRSRRRSSSRSRRRGSSSGGGRRQRRSSSSSKSSRSRSRRRNRRRRSSSRSSRSRDRDYRRKRRRSSRSSRSRSRSKPRRSRSSRSKSRSRYSRRRSRSRTRRHSTRSSRSNSRGRNHRRRKSRKSTSSSSSSSSSSPTSSPAKSSSTRGSGRKRSKSSSSSPVHHRLPGRKSRSKERPILPVLQQTKEPENGCGAAVAVPAFTVESTILPPVAHQPSIPLTLLKEPTPPPPPPVRRYYGRGRKESSQNSSSEWESESGSESDNEKDGKSSGASGGVKHNGSQGHSSRRDSDVSKGKSSMVMMMNSASKEEIMSSVGGTSSVNLSVSSSAANCLSNVAKLTPKERLRRKMQSALTKTFKADKEAEKQRQEKLIQERMEREESLRELTIKYRRREREKRHRDREIGGRSSSSDSSFSGSRSRSPSPQSSPNTRRKTSRSRSRSPVSNY